MEIIKLNLIPSGVNPVCHCSQYDTERVIRAELFDGLTPYSLASGDEITLNVRKPDNTVVTADVSVTEGNNYVDLTTTEQICACVGENLCDLTITNGSKVIGTLNFIMQVERDVLADGIPSQSVIEDLDALVQEAVGDNYYTKAQADALLNDKADKSNTYTKTETDSLLALKADKSELYNVYPTEQESGAIAHFTDGADNIPVKSLVSQIVAVQSGSGTPSPNNPRAISGFDSGVITRYGVNLWDEEWENGYYNPSTGAYVADAHYICSKNLIKVSPSTQYYIHSDNNILIEVLEYRIDGTFIRRLSSGIANQTITTDNDCAYIHIGTHDSNAITTYTSGVSINYPSTDTQYHAYNGDTYTFAFGQTVYGGHFDNKGNLVVTHNIVDLGTLNWDYIPNNLLFTSTVIGKKPSIVVGMVSQYVNGDWWTGWTDKNYVWCGNANNSGIVVKDTRFTDAISFKNGVSGVKFVYELNTPITLAITSQDIPTALGENNFYSNTGDVDVTIRADIGLYIDKRLNTTRSTPTLSLSKGNSTLSETQVKYEDPVEESENNNEER